MLKSFSNAVIPLIDNQHIQDYLLIEKTKLRPADVILVFGNRHSIHKLSEQAAFLYHKGYAPKIIASGGHPDQNNISESQFIKHCLLTQGVHDDDILVESRSTNTQENVLFSKEIMEQRHPKKSVNRVIGVGSIVAGRRFLMTLSTHWPEALPMISNVNPFDTPIKKWITDPKFQEVVVAEYQKIQPYIENGFIKEIDIDNLNLRVQNTVKNSCPFNYSKA